MDPQKELQAYNDEELHILIKRGNKEAMLALFDRYSEKLYLYIFQRVSSCIPDGDAEKVAAHILKHVFTALWDNIAPHSVTSTASDLLFLLADGMISHYICFGTSL